MRMLRSHSYGPALALLLAVVAGLSLLGCEPDQEAIDKFPRGEANTPMEPGELVSYKLDNGISVLMMTEPSRNRLAVEVLFRAGIVHEPAGGAQVAHMTEHLVMRSATASYPPSGAINAIVDKGGRTNAEVVGDFAHVDYFSVPERLETILKIETERLQSIKFDNETRDAEATKCRSEIDFLLTNSTASWIKVGLTAFVQALYHGETQTSVYDKVGDISLEQIRTYHQARFTTDNMAVVLLGAFDVDEAKQMIANTLGTIPRTTAAPPRKPRDSSRMEITWDLPQPLLYLSYKTADATEREKFVLTMFGTYANALLIGSPNLKTLTSDVFATSNTYPVGDLPFHMLFVPLRGVGLDEIRDLGSQMIEAAISEMDERLYRRIQASTINFAVSEPLRTKNISPDIPYQNILGQEALNLGMRHYFRRGLSAQEYEELIRSVSLEDARAILQKYLSADNMQTVVIKTAAR